MEGSESPRHRKRSAAFAWLCCGCSETSEFLEPDSRTVRITAGIVAIIAMLISGIGFSALQRATVNPYEHLFATGSSVQQYMTPTAWGPAFAPAPGPFLQPVLPASDGSVSIESANEGAPEPAPGSTLEALSSGPSSSLNNRAAPAGLDQLYGSPTSASAAPAGSTAAGSVGSIESAPPGDSSAASPGTGQAELSPISDSNSSSGRAQQPSLLLYLLLHAFSAQHV